MIPVIDIFAGPGGLNEGFSRVQDESGNPVFSIKGSFEMESRAVETLTLRAALRRISESTSGQATYKRFLETEGVDDRLATRFPSAFKDARKHVYQIELGEDTRQESDELIRDGIVGNNDFVLIGGPPCQAYSLVGRSRRRNDKHFYADKKHFLFKEYLHILEEFQPAVFVMENVKGLLSATHGGLSMFDLIKDDLELDGTYVIQSLVVETDDPQPSDFVIRAEEYGVPQRRHRVILLGVRHDLSHFKPPVLTRTGPVHVRDVIDGMKPIRSILTHDDSHARWEWAKSVGIQASTREAATQRVSTPSNEDAAASLRRWLKVGQVPLTQHSSRRHMDLDVARYAYYAQELEKQRRPRVHELPQGLRPAHKNINGEATPFSDRFWAQAWDEPSSTIVSHLGKDGHHFIHPDKSQARSLTVREAARLQTFPDDYWFCGPRTSQYQQVGNAVPPLLAHQIGHVVARVLRITGTGIRSARGRQAP